MAAARRTAILIRTPADARRTRRAAVRTGHRSRAHPGACAWPSNGRAFQRVTAGRSLPAAGECAARPRPSPRPACGCANFRSVTGFYIAGSVLAAWALLVTAVGVTREDFPSSDGATRLVGAISVLLVVAAIGSAIYLSATEEHEPKGEHAAAR